jgi:hypothetical protein
MIILYAQNSASCGDVYTLKKNFAQFMLKKYSKILPNTEKTLR